MSTTSMHPATSSSQNPSPSSQNLSLPYASRHDKLIGSVIDASTTLLAAYDHDIVKFGMGAPAPDMLPAKDFARIAGEVFSPLSANLATESYHRGKKKWREMGNGVAAADGREGEP